MYFPKQCIAFFVLSFCISCQAASYIKPVATTAQVTVDTVIDVQNATDDNIDTEASFKIQPGRAGDAVVSFVLDFGRPQVIDSVEVITGKKLLHWLSVIEVSGDGKEYRPLLGTSVNLAHTPGGKSIIPVRPSVGRFLRITFRGVREGSVSEIKVTGRINIPERHYLGWTNNPDDYSKNLDFLEKDMGITDIWISYLATPFPETTPTSGFDAYVKRDLFKKFKDRGINYWLGEHESFTFLVRDPESLRNDLAWDTVFRQMRKVYAQARELGFRGIAADVEAYNGVTAAAKEKYKDKADHVSPWSFTDEFGYQGYYYQRGRQIGTILKEVWPEAIMIQFPGLGARDGHYWYLQGMAELGVEIWIGIEKTYGAGNSELANKKALDHCTRWFLPMSYVNGVFGSYPFASKVLPGFHPWNKRTGRANYLPKYLKEQIKKSMGLTQGYWIYTEGTADAGDPRKDYDKAFWNSHKVKPEDFLRILRQTRKK